MFSVPFGHRAVPNTSLWVRGFPLAGTCLWETKAGWRSQDQGRPGQLWGWLLSWGAGALFERQCIAFACLCAWMCCLTLGNSQPVLNQPGWSAASQSGGEFCWPEAWALLGIREQEGCAAGHLRGVRVGVGEMCLQCSLLVSRGVSIHSHTTASPAPSPCFPQGALSGAAPREPMGIGMAPTTP